MFTYLIENNICALYYCIFKNSVFVTGECLKKQTKYNIIRTVLGASQVGRLFLNRNKTK